MSRFTPDDSFQPCFYDVALVSALLSGKSIFSFSLSLFHFFTFQANEDYDFEGKNGENGEEDCERFFTCISISLSPSIQSISYLESGECCVYLRKIIYVYFRLASIDLITTDEGNGRM